MDLVEIPGRRIAHLMQRRVEERHINIATLTRSVRAQHGEDQSRRPPRIRFIIQSHSIFQINTDKIGPLETAV